MERNISTMQDFFAERPVRLRPHFKSPKAPAIARRLLDAGAVGLTCAKVGEAEVLVEHGLHDILIATQVVGPHKISRLVRLAKQADVTVAVDDPENVVALSSAAAAAGVTLHVLVEVDVGMHRCGVRCAEMATHLVRLASNSRGLCFRGLMGYEGHAVMIPDRATRALAAEAAMSVLAQTASAVRQAGFAVDVVSAGGTGTYDITGTYAGVTEIQAGSYVLMDGRYRQVDVPFVCALSLLTTVVSVPDAHRRRAESRHLRVRTSRDQGSVGCIARVSLRGARPSAGSW